MKLFNAIATAICPGVGLALYAYDDIKENGFLNSTTKKVIEFGNPSLWLADKALEDVQENGWKNSTLGQLANTFLYGEKGQFQAEA